MKPQLLSFGNDKSAVVIVDQFSGDPERAARIADELAPFPPEVDSYYPGVRRIIDEGDAAAYEYVVKCCRDSAQFIAGAFDVPGFELLRASFSIVTLEPHQLSPVQRSPHFDSTDHKYFALLHYLRVPSHSGTAFYRQRSTGIERVTEENVTRFMSALTSQNRFLPARSGYIQGSNEFFEQIGAVEAISDRLVIYQGSLLHSGIIPADMAFSADPRYGRLTANLFVRGQ